MRLIRALADYSSAQLSAKLGRCPKCMGLSLSGAATGWLALTSVLQIWPQFPFANLMAFLPASFSVLWLLHVFTYGGRVLAAERQAQLEGAVRVPVITRRRLTCLFIGSAVLAIGVSIKSATGWNDCCSLPGSGDACGSCVAGSVCQVAGPLSMCAPCGLCEKAFSGGK
jgi:hypothetical protein